MSFPNLIHGSEERVFDDLSTETVPVGSKMILEDGRIFRFTEAAGTALVVGNLNQGAVPSTNTSGEAIATLAAGVTVLTDVVSSSSTTGIDLMRFGYIHTDNATTLPLVRIKSNNLLPTSGTGGEITLFWPTPTAIASGNTVSYYENPWRDVIIHASPATAVYTGVCKTALTANQYGWLQTQGPVSGLYDTGTTAIAAVNDPVVGSVAVDGAFEGAANATADTDPMVGTQMGIIEGNTEQIVIFLRLE